MMNRKLPMQFLSSTVLKLQQQQYDEIADELQAALKDCRCVSPTINAMMQRDMIQYEYSAQAVFNTVRVNVCNQI